MTAPLFAELPGDIRISFEVFPPKTEKMELQLWDAITQLSRLAPASILRLRLSRSLCALAASGWTSG